MDKSLDFKYEYVHEIDSSYKMFFSSCRQLSQDWKSTFLRAVSPYFVKQNCLQHESLPLQMSVDESDHKFFTLNRLLWLTFITRVSCNILAGTHFETESIQTQKVVLWLKENLEHCKLDFQKEADEEMEVSPWIRIDLDIANRLLTWMAWPSRWKKLDP